LLQAAVLLLLTAHVAATPLEFALEPSAGIERSVQVAVSNPRGEAVTGLGWALMPGDRMDCAIGAVGITNGMARLEAGHAVECRWTPAPQRSRSAVAFHGRKADGEVFRHSLHFDQRGAATVPQGVVVLTAGGIHNDTDIDGLLDAGETIDYRYTLLNLGTLDLSALQVDDLDGSVSCPATTLAVGDSMLCNRSHAVSAAEEAAGRVDNPVEVTSFDALGLPVQSADLLLTLNLAGRAGLRVVKSPFLLDDSDASGFASIGDRLRYDFVVANIDADSLSQVTLVEPDPTRIDTPIVCQSQTLSGAAYGGNGSGVLEALDLVLCSAEYQIRQLDVDLGEVLNLVEASARTPLAATVAASGASSVVLPGSGELTVSKSVDAAQVAPGQLLNYIIEVSNTGSVTLFNVQVEDPVPLGISAFVWTCAGALCPNPSGTGAISETIPAFPPGETVIYTVEAEVAADAPNLIVNRVTVLPPALVVCRPDDTPSPCQAQAPVNVLVTEVAIPMLGPLGMLLLVLSLLLAGVFGFRRAASS
jgi:uncharacterized repeat protein (TIGR01451 family)